MYKPIRIQYLPVHGNTLYIEKESEKQKINPANYQPEDIPNEGEKAKKKT